MEVVNVDTSALAAMAAPYNPRKIDDHDLAALRRSLATWGAVEPVVVNQRTGRVVGGHQRIRAAELEGIATMPVVYVDLDDAGERQLNLALNRISGEFDKEKLEALVAELQAAGAEMALTGFTDDEIAELMRGAPADGLTDPDDIPAPPDEPITALGDLVVLGDHRLLCGDAGSAKDLDRLLAGELAQLVNTDPPYNVKVEPRSNNAVAMGLNTKGNVPSDQRQRLMHHQGFDLARRKSKAKPVTSKMRAKDRVLENDFITDEAFRLLLTTWFGAISNALQPGRAFYVWGGYSNIKNYPAAFDGTDLYFAQTVIWHKQWPVLTRKDFMGDHEWCFYGWKQGAPHYFDPAKNNATDVWVVKKVTPTAMVHLTEKPVELAERAMTYSSRPGETVLDLFGGSGSTLIGAERMSRRSRIMEMDPAYCDVIIERWEKFTGKKAKRPKRAASGGVNG